MHRLTLRRGSTSQLFRQQYSARFECPHGFGRSRPLCEQSDRGPDNRASDNARRRSPRRRESLGIFGALGASGMAVSRSPPAGEARRRGSADEKQTLHDLRSK